MVFWLLPMKKSLLQSKKIIQKGCNPKKYTRLVFDRAHEQYVCKLAYLLEIKTIIVPVYGMREVSIERFTEQQLLILCE